jgi:hypothetical protein
MKRVVRISQGVVGGVEKELIESIVPQLEGSFRQRKEFFEFYFDEKEVELSLENIDELSSEFQIKLNWDELEIII